MPDQSHLDQRYFVDSTVYNCPFCNRRNVEYSIFNHVEFDWTDEKRCWVFFVQCHSCLKKSMHLTFKKLGVCTKYNRRYFDLPSDVDDEGAILDDAMFYSVPTSFFVLDERVPRVLRDLLTEAEGCLKSNFLICLRTEDRLRACTDRKRDFLRGSNQVSKVGTSRR